MKLVIKIFAGIVLTLAIAIGVLIGYQTWKANQPVENTGGYFTLGENGVTIYVPAGKIEENLIEEEILTENITTETIWFENTIIQCVS